jgi:hypothetical protein
MRNTPEGRAFVRLAAAERDAPFGEYGQADPKARPRT